MNLNESTHIDESGGFHPFWTMADGLPADILCQRILMANVVMLDAEDGWVLVDAGLHGYADDIVSTARSRFGDTPPRAILLTHGHFDHVGALPALLDVWHVPVYAHSLELPYLTGKRDYPRANPDAGDGLMSLVSPLYPREAHDFSEHIQCLPEDGTVPGLPEWRWLHTPGHTEGHVSFFRMRDATVIAGDCFITVKQESAWSVITQEQAVHGPPAYFTTDWSLAAASVKRMASLRPEMAITGHGFPMQGAALRQGLEALAADFDALCTPPSSPLLH